MTRRPLVRRPVARRLGALAVSLALVASIAGLVGAAWHWPAPAVRSADPLAVVVDAGRTDLVCAGPPRPPTADAGVTYDPAFEPAPEGTTTGVLGLSLGLDDGPAPGGQFVAGLASGAGAATPLGPTSEPAAVLSTRVDGPGVLSADPDDGAAPLIVGATLAHTQAGDLRGLQGALCQEPTRVAWLVGGTTRLGGSVGLVLDNAGDTPATVDFSLWGASGPIDPGAAGTVLVPPRSERIVLLEAVAPEQARLAARLTASGGRVAAWLQVAELRGFTPGGADLATPAAEPSTHVIVPGLALTDTTLDDADPAAIRIVNPHDERATAALRLLGAQGEVSIPGAETLELEPGSVTDVPLAGVGAGAYAAEIVADLPVTAAGLLTRTGSPNPDDPDEVFVERAWSAAGTASGRLLLALPPGDGALVDAAVLLTNPGAAEVVADLRVVRASGDIEAAGSIPVAARSTVRLGRERFADAVGLEVTAAPDHGGLLGAVVVTASADGELVTVLGAQPDPQAALGVQVRLARR